MLTFAASIAGATAVVFAALMLVQRSLYSAALCLLAVLLQGAVLFFLSGAPLLAFLQILIYAGAVLVLIVVTIMAAPSPDERPWAALSIPRPLVAAALILPPLEIGLVLALGGWEPAPAGLLAAQQGIGSVLFGPFALATEAVTVLMFLAGLAVLPSPRPPSGNSLAAGTRR